MRSAFLLVLSFGSLRALPGLRGLFSCQLVLIFKQDSGNGYLDEIRWKGENHNNALSLP